MVKKVVVPSLLLLLPPPLAAGAAAPASSSNAHHPFDALRLPRRLGGGGGKGGNSDIMVRSTESTNHRQHRQQQQQHQPHQQQPSRALPAAGWQTWPSTSVSNLVVIHSLCDDYWIDALNDAVSSYNALSGKVNMIIEAEPQCEPRHDKNLEYIDNTIHVVYGTCGSDCCGFTDVEYSYDGDGTITRYSALVRVDKSCFEEDEAEGMQFLMCHELGHALGLGHSDDYDGSCMASTYFPGGGYLPGEEDIETLDEELYGDAPDADGAGGGGGSSSGGGWDDGAAQEEEPDPTFDPTYRPTYGPSRNPTAAPVAAPVVAPPMASPVAPPVAAPEAAPVSFPVPAPMAAPASPPQAAPVVQQQQGTAPPPLPELTNGPAGRDCSTAQPCSVCEGDCDSDDQCEFGLSCYRRNGFDTVPGCGGYGDQHFDYCIDPNAITAPQVEVSIGQGGPDEPNGDGSADDAAPDDATTNDYDGGNSANPDVEGEGPQQVEVTLGQGPDDPNHDSRDDSEPEPPEPPANVESESQEFENGDPPEVEVSIGPADSTDDASGDVSYSGDDDSPEDASNPEEESVAATTAIAYSPPGSKMTTGKIAITVLAVLLFLAMSFSAYLLLLWRRRSSRRNAWTELPPDGMGDKQARSGGGVGGGGGTARQIQHQQPSSSRSRSSPDFVAFDATTPVVSFESAGDGGGGGGGRWLQEEERGVEVRSSRCEYDARFQA